MDTENKNQARFRVVRADGKLELPRRYAQSTSGRMCSHFTTPPLSRSSAMAVDSAIRSLAEIAFRRYPTEVSQRPAKAACSCGLRELRYLRSDSMDTVLRNSNDCAIPFVHLLSGNAPYDREMDIQETRRARLRLLVKEFSTQTALAKQLDVEQNYISRLLKNGHFGEKTARKIETKANKPQGWLDGDIADQEPSLPEWLSSVDPVLWGRLEPHQKREIDEAVAKLVLGASVQKAVTTPARRKDARHGS
jgi:hypothetical protein